MSESVGRIKASSAYRCRVQPAEMCPRAQPVRDILPRIRRALYVNIRRVSGVHRETAAVKPFGQLDDPRRRVLIQALAAGFFSSAGSAAAQIFGTPPKKLPAGQSIYRLS